jgi:hypothetical protein
VQPSEAYDRTVTWVVEPVTGNASINNNGSGRTLIATEAGTVSVSAISINSGDRSNPVEITITAAPPAPVETESIITRDPDSIGGTGAIFNQTTLSFTGTIDYYLADQDAGRPVPGNYVGVTISAPPGVTVDRNNASINYFDASREEVYLIGPAWLTGADNSVNYYAFLEPGDQTFQVLIDWDGTGAAYATEVIDIDVSGATLATAP